MPKVFIRNGVQMCRTTKSCDKPYHKSVNSFIHHLNCLSSIKLSYSAFLCTVMKVLLECHRAHQSPSPGAAQGWLQFACISICLFLHSNQIWKAHCIWIQVAPMYKSEHGIWTEQREFKIWYFEREPKTSIGTFFYWWTIIQVLVNWKAIKTEIIMATLFLFIFI
jgi:hypothetical protein